MSILLYLDLAETQASGHTYEEFFLSCLKWGKPTFNPNLLRWRDPPLIWATSSHGSLYKRSSLFACLPSLLLASAHLHWHYFFRILVYTEDPTSPTGRQPSLGQLDHSLQAILMNHWSIYFISSVPPENPDTFLSCTPYHFSLLVSCALFFKPTEFTWRMVQAFHWGTVITEADSLAASSYQALSTPQLGSLFLSFPSL